MYYCHRVYSIVQYSVAWGFAAEQENFLNLPPNKIIFRDQQLLTVEK